MRFHGNELQLRPMAEQIPGVGPSNSDTAPGESSGTNLELNVKTLDSRTFHFQVDKNMQVSSFKEKIANDIGIAVGQQRLIFRGKVLKDDHLLSQYHVETGDTLHLVERQPTQPQPSSGSGSGETTSNVGNRGYDANAGIPRGRVGQISHSVVLGTFNVGDQGENTAPDITRVIGTVLNSIGLYGNGQSPISLNIPGQGPQGSGTEGDQGNVGGQGQAANQPSGQATPNVSFQSLPPIVQVPLSAPIPDSMNTLMEFMNLMEQTLSRNVNQQNPSSTSSVELPPTARGMPSSDALSIVLRQAERLLSGQAVTALSHIAGRLEHEGSSSDPSLRSQIQTEAARTGVEMQHLGALLLELGRTMLCLRMGQSPVESFVNAGPAVYISSFGPNPIMVQPFPLQTNSLFGVPRFPPPPVNQVGNRVTFGPVGVGNPPRHLNIHIHAGTSLAPVVSAADGRSRTGEGIHGERGDSNSSRDSGTVHTLRNVVLGTGPPRPSGLPGSTAPQPIPVSGTQSIPDTAGLVAEINSQLRRLVGNIQEGNQAPSSGRAATSVRNPSAGSASAQEQPNLAATTGGTGTACSSTESLIESADRTLASGDATGSSAGAMPSLKVEGASSSSGSNDAHEREENTNSTPLGLGLGGLERKKRPKQPKPQPKGGDGGDTSTIPERPTVQTSGQQLLQSLLSRGSTAERTNTSTVGMGSPSPFMSQATNSNTSAAAQDSNSQFDVAGMMSQVLQSPALNGLLSGVSEQTGAGSPDVLRNMLQQVTQNPMMMNTVSRIAQQVDTQDLGSMFAGMGGGQGRGGGGSIDLSRMIQQMMPIVSQALGGTESFPPAAGDHGIGGQPTERRHDAEDRDSDRIERAELESLARQIESQTPIEDVFRSMAEYAAEASDNGSDIRDLLDGVCGDEELANDYAEILSQDLSRRLRDRAEDR